MFSKLTSFEAIKNAIFGVGAVCGATIAQVMGGWDTAMETLVVFMAVDYLCGIIVAGCFKRSGKTETGALDSKAGFLGLLRKVAILLSVVVATYLDRILGDAAFARTAVILFFTANEGLSIIENLALMGVPFPPHVKEALEQMKRNEEEIEGRNMNDEDNDLWNQ